MQKFLRESLVDELNIQSLLTVEENTTDSTVCHGLKIRSSAKAYELLYSSKCSTLSNVCVDISTIHATVASPSEAC